MHFSTLVALEDLSYIDDTLEPFASDPDNEEYLEFYDETEDLKEEYDTREITAIQMPSGKLISSHELDYNRYKVENGLVYEKTKDGTYKRTKRACSMSVIPNKPAKEVYKTYRSYASRHVGADYNKERGKFGYFSNPNAMWDWWSIGGRYSGRFIVKKDCEDCWDCVEKEAQKYIPKGYKAVDGARICDIEWGVMNKVLVKTMIKDYYKFKRIYMTGDIPEKSGLHIDKDKKALIYFGTILYSAGETLEEYLKETRFSRDIKYNVPCYYYLNLESEWKESNGNDKEWQRKINDEIKACDKDMCLAMVDCHM